MTTDELTLKHLVQTPRVPAGARAPLVVLLHGYGSNELDLFGLAPQLDERCLIVSARAPLTLAQTGGHAWFNIEYTANGLTADLEQAEQSRSSLIGFLDELQAAYPIDPGRVYLAGFSQGAMMSLSVMLARPEKIAGVLALSGRLPAAVLPRLETHAPEAYDSLPVFVAHGLYDPVIPVVQGRACRDELRRLPLHLTYREYPMGHEVSLETLRDAAGWLSATLNAPARPPSPPLRARTCA